MSTLPQPSPATNEFLQRLEAFFERAEERAEQRFNKALEAALERMESAVPGGPADGGGGGCKGDACQLGGGCKGKCHSCRHAKLQKEVGPVPRTIYNAYLNCVSMRPGCYHQNVDDPELEHAWCAMGQEYGYPRMANVIRLDDDVVPFDTNVGAAPFINFPTNPIAANQKALLRTNSGQQGPFRGGCLKAAIDWNGEARNSAVTVTFYVGPRDVVDINLADLAEGGPFVRYGKPKKLSLWTCGDKCFLVAWPKWMGCEPPITTYKEALYVLVEVGPDAGASTIASLDLTMLKAGTAECGRCLNLCGSNSCG